MKLSVSVRMMRDGRYVAHCPTLPGCFASANDRNILEQRIREAVEGYLASLDAETPTQIVVSDVLDGQNASRMI